MGVVTRKLAVTTTQNKETDQFTTGVAFLTDLKILSISTRVDGKTDNKQTVISEAKLKTVALLLKDKDGKEIHNISLYRVLQLSSLGNGYGLQVNSQIDFANSQLTYNDPASMVTGEAVELTFECEK